MDDQLEDFFRQRLQGHEEQPPAQAWHRIKEDIAPAKPPKKVIGRRLAALLLLSVATAWLLLRLLPAESIENTAIATQQPTEATSATTGKATTENTALLQKESEVISDEKDVNKPVLTSVNAENPKAAGGKNQAAATQNPSANNAADQITNVKAGKTPATGNLAIANSKRKKASLNGYTENKPALTKARNNKIKPAADITGSIALADKNAPSATSAKITATPAEAKKPAGTEQNSNAAGSLNNQNNAGNNSGANQNIANQAIAPVIAEGTLTNETDNQTTQTGTTVTSEQNSTAAIAAPDSVLAAADSVTEDLTTEEALEATAETTDTTYVRSHKTLFGFYAGTQIGYRKFTPNQQDDVFISQLSTRKKPYSERMNFEAGAIIKRSFSNRFAVEGAVGALYTRDKIEYEVKEAVATELTTSFTPNGLSLQPGFTQNMHQTSTSALYTRARTGLVFSAVKSRATEVSVTGGGFINLLTQHKTESTVNGESTEAAYKPQNMQGGVYAGLRFGKAFSRKLDVALEPGVNYYFNSQQNQNQAFQLRTHTYNINLLFFFR